MMKYELSAHEARIIGSLMEKSITTPDYYPLSLNSLVTACNQKSNREPVMNLSESQVIETVEGLISRRFVSDESGFNSRTSKYQHRFCNTEFGDLQLTEQELGIICCLLLRGPQTPGELRTRTNRLCALPDMKTTEHVLKTLIERELVARLAREPGKREIRYRQTFTPYDASEDMAESAAEAPAQPERLDILEQEVETLKQEVQWLRAQIDELLSSHE